ncbi:MAG TPA: MotA/TolQ/ExbB proton channel family protein, partial [Planctomycetia bacterium]|nr:MotA/TolQ/ExbB proton channel family protein [Planctomycetia bacterium]
MPRANALALAALLFAGVAAAQEGAAPAPARPAGQTISLARPLELIRLTGWAFWPLLACSLIAITYGLERAVTLRRRRVIPGAFLRRFRRKLSAGELDRNGAIEMCRANGSAIAEIYLAIVRLWGRPTLELQKAASEAAHIQMIWLKRNLRVFQSIANVATLLGLFGTVLGMIRAFNNVSELRGSQRGVELSHGIAEALVATGFGLAVAIPALALYTFFSLRVEKLALELDSEAGELIDACSAETLAAPASGPRAAVRRPA